MGNVNQDPMLFNDTIDNNIAFGIENATLEQVEQAARIANAHEFILQTEHGYQTIIGDRGGKLSGGQRQRLSIARAVLKNPPIMILDEATSALDTESEKLVQEALDNLMKNRTSIVIAHRLSTVVGADKILVLEEGRIVEQGTLEDVFDHTKHPYTEGLFNSLPNIQNRTAMLKPIKGLMPDPTNLPEGCAFAPRCDYATDECSKRCPKLTKISDTHSFACLAYEHEGFHIKRGNE